MVSENALKWVRTGQVDDTAFGADPPDDNGEESSKEDKASSFRARIRRFPAAFIDVAWRCIRAAPLGF